MSRIFSLLFAALVGGTAAAQSSTAATATPLEGTVETYAYPKDYVLYPRVQVIEEGTGTWCGFCPRGIVTIERLHKELKNVPFVVIAVHRSQGYTIEPMAVEDYHFLGFGGFPAGWVNRKKKVDMSFYNTRNVLQQQPKKTPFKVETKVTKTDTFDYDITLTSTLGFDNTKTNLRIQYVLVEDKVGPYNQTNYFSNRPELEGADHPWVKKPYQVSTLYDDVARKIYPVGIEAEQVGILPTEMRRGVSVSQTFHLFLPGNVMNPENLRVVGLLIDNETQEILNADVQKLPTVVGTSTAIMPLAPSAPSDSDTPHYDLSGRRISPSQPGLHIVKGKLEVRR